MTDIEELKKRLRCGAPSSESWHILAARTNDERWRAADAIEQLQRDIEERKRTHNQLLVAYHMAQHEAAQLQRELEEARKDAEIDAHPEDLGTGPTWVRDRDGNLHLIGSRQPPDVDQAIADAKDAARQQKG